MHLKRVCTLLQFSALYNISAPMRILLDSRDLIDVVEHGRPVTPENFEAYVRDRNHQVVLSFTNIRELSSPLAEGAEFMRVRPLLQALERMQHLCLKETTIIPSEIRAAVTAFLEGAEYQSPSPYVPRWEHVLVVDPLRHRLPTEDWIDFRLDEIIYYINRARPDVFAPPEHDFPGCRLNSKTTVFSSALAQHLHDNISPAPSRTMQPAITSLSLQRGKRNSHAGFT